LGSGKWNLGWKSKRIVITVESSDHIGVANGELIEWLSAVDKDRLALGVFPNFGVALTWESVDRKTGAAHICQDVENWAGVPVEIKAEGDAGTPGNSVIVETADGAVRRNAIFGGLVGGAGHTDAEGGDYQC
jgi:hypothetical protein